MAFRIFAVIVPFILHSSPRTFRAVREWVFIMLVLIGATYSLGVQAKLRTMLIPQTVVVEDIPLSSSSTFVQYGIASWYGPRFHGRRTANGEIYDMYSFTAAHLTLPLGTVVRVTNIDNNKTILVRINDRGPYIEGRILDLSYSSAKALGIVENGTAYVKIEVIEGIRLSDSTLQTNFLSTDYEFTALKDLLTTTAFAHDMQPLVVSPGTCSIVYETDHFADALTTWQQLRKKHGNVIYLVPQRKPSEQLVYEELSRRARRKQASLRTSKADKHSINHPLLAQRQERTRLYNYQLLLLETGANTVSADTLQLITGSLN
ncbi:MAG: septal ring lytic transglycosylase RlpA family protein [Bacteroidota bacterium]|nr:septal ring lytic transglycosylase RlpA family protein [Bacteroidota bacterium]